MPEIKVYCKFCKNTMVVTRFAQVYKCNKCKLLIYSSLLNEPELDIP